MLFISWLILIVEFKIFYISYVQVPLHPDQSN